jgi:hypothetical protein
MDRDPETERRLAEQREKTLQHLLKVVEEAYRQKRISMSADHGGVVYTISIPHERTGPGFDLFASAMPVV